jgi:hypothetical protein
MSVSTDKNHSSALRFDPSTISCTPHSASNEAEKHQLTAALLADWIASLGPVENGLRDYREMRHSLP